MKTLFTMLMMLGIAGVAMANAPAADFVADIQQGGNPVTVQFTDLTTNTPTSWEWDFGDGGASTDQNPTHTYTEPGNYTVSLTATNAGGSDTEIKTNYVTVGAYPHFGTNTLGCYFDSDGIFENGQELINSFAYTPSVPYNLYFVMSDCSQPSIGGFEFAWRFNPDPAGAYFILGLTLPPNALNIGNNRNLIVGLGSPLPMLDQHMVLAAVNIFPITGGLELDVQVSQAAPASIPGEPGEHGYCVFNDGDDPALLFIMAFSTEDLATATYTQVENGNPGPGDDFFYLDTPLAHVGTEQGPVATESATLSEIKALFR